MIAIPAIDLRESHCVQLVGGDPDREAVRLSDPLHVARRWVAAGFQRLHVADLDAALGRGDNRPIVRDILRHADTPVQVGGGVRDDETFASLLADGADAIVVGTRAIEDPSWVAELAQRAPGRVIVAADVRERAIVVKGWTTASRRSVRDVIAELEEVPLAGLLVTAVHREGRLQGPDLPLMDAIVEVAPWPVIAAGGIGSLLDLRNLEERGVSATILGMALYTEALDARAVAEEFGTWDR
jgi:phosphoribosylformimino-5-aminoimidazole carboxamide ribotide isomerase